VRQSRTLFTSRNATKLLVVIPKGGISFVFAIVGMELKIGHTSYEILQILGVSLLDKTSVKELLTNIIY
jgi:hypothetical protein